MRGAQKVFVISCWLSIITLGWLNAPNEVRADGQGMPDAPEAHQAYEAGADAYEEGRFRDALGAFERAYALSARPKLLFNIARSADEDGQNQRAIDAYKAYLLALPSAPNRRFVESRIAVLGKSKRRPEAASPLAQQLISRRLELNRMLLHREAIGKGGPIATILLGTVLFIGGLPPLVIGLAGGCDDDVYESDCVPNPLPSIYIPGAVLVTAGLSTLIAGAVLLHKRKAKRRAIQTELQQIDEQLSKTGIEASIAPWIVAPRSAAHGASAGLTLSMRF